MLNKKITKLLVGTNNRGKLIEIKGLLPKNVKIYSPSDFKIKSPAEIGKNFSENMTSILYKIGIVFQQHTLDFDLSVTKNLIFYADIHGMPRAQSYKKINELLDRFDLHEFKNYKARDLSGGMKRRLEIARALLKDPKILILDEATSGLDPSGREKILADVKDLTLRDKITVLTITHLESEINDVTKILKIEKGRIV